MNARRVITLLVVLAAVGAAVLVALRYRQETAAKASVAVPQVVQPVELDFAGTLQAATAIAVAVPIAGKIESFEVQVGDEVYEGQLLGRIRSGALESQKEMAEIDLERAETRIRNMEGAMSAARLEASRASADAVRVRDALDRATKYYKRQKMLLEEGATPRNTFQKAEAEFLALEVESKNLDEVATVADERVTSLQRELDLARKLLEAKSEDVLDTNEAIGSGDVLSPDNGIVVGRRGQEGDDVHPSMTDLFQIAPDLSTMLAVVEASPENVKGIQPGQPAIVTVVEMGGEPLQGTVSKVEEGKLTVEFANPNPLVKPGLTAQIRIKIT